MGTINFFTGTMSSGKTTHLLQTHFNLEAAFPNQVILINRNDRAGESVCSNRLGGATLSIGITPESDLLHVISNQEENAYTSIKYIFIDEVQFFSIEQIEQLAYLADIKDCEIYAYGLLTSYKGKLFPSTSRLIELCDKIIHINNEMRCWCGERATHNALFMHGVRIKTGDNEVVDRSSLIDYEVMCRKHFLEHIDHQVTFAEK